MKNNTFEQANNEGVQCDQLSAGGLLFEILKLDVLDRRLKCSYFIHGVNITVSSFSNTI